jgi:predicted O-methyltransferase YrrM
VFRDLGALSTINNLHTLRQLMLELEPERTLEVGLSFGGSCLALAATHRDLGHSPGRQHVALDPFQSTVWDDCGIEMVARAGLDGFLDFRPEFSSIELPRLLSAGVRFGLIYVDGSHLFEEVFVDSFFAARLLEEGGVLAFDDSTNPHVRKALRFVRSNLRESLKELDLSGCRADSGRSLRYRVAKTFGKVQLTAFRRIGVIERKWNVPYRSF